MKIIIVTQSDPFYLPIFFQRFFEIKPKFVDLRGVVIQKTINKKSNVKFIKKIFGFYGFINFFRFVIMYSFRLIKSIFFKIHISKKPVFIEDHLKHNQINKLKYTNVNSESFIQFCEDENVDLIISVSAAQIFKPKILNTPKFGCINIHNGQLPKYRGMLPNFWQMYNNEKNSTLTIHQMDKKLDKGKIVFQKTTQILDNDSLHTLIKKTKYNSAEAIVNVINQLSDNTLTYIEPDEKIEGNYYSFPTKSDVDQFKRNGKKII